jgi:DNA-binding transcriptional MerR regulator
MIQLRLFREPALRTVDLARIAGVSTQQIRNYVDEGVLPPAPRTPSGYRTFGERHRRALLAYRTLAKGYGWPTARAIMTSVHADDVPEALALVDASHASLHLQRIRLREAGQALEILATTPPDQAVPRAGLRIGEVARLLSIRASALRLWEESGLLHPERERGTKYRRYSPADIRDARMVHMLRQGRYPIPRIRPILDELRRTGSRDALRAAIAQRQTELTQRAASMLEGAGRLHAYLTDQDIP